MSLGLVSWTAARLVTLLTATSLPWYSASGVNSWSTSVVLVVVSDIVEWTLRRCQQHNVIKRMMFSAAGGWGVKLFVSCTCSNCLTLSALVLKLSSSILIFHNILWISSSNFLFLCDIDDIDLLCHTVVILLVHLRWVGTRACENGNRYE